MFGQPTALTGPSSINHNGNSTTAGRVEYFANIPTSINTRWNKTNKFFHFDLTRSISQWRHASKMENFVQRIGHLPIYARPMHIGQRVHYGESTSQFATGPGLWGPEAHSYPFPRGGGGGGRVLVTHPGWSCLLYIKYLLYLPSPV